MWLVQKLAHRAGCVFRAHVLRRGNRLCVYSAFRSYLVSHASQARREPSRCVFRPGVDCALFPDGNRRLECMASWGWLDRSLVGDYDFSDSTRPECRMVRHLLWHALAWLGLHRDHTALGSDSGDCPSVLADLHVVRRAPGSLPRLGHLCGILECRNLAFESSAQPLRRSLCLSESYPCNPR